MISSGGRPGIGSRSLEVGVAVQVIFVLYAMPTVDRKIERCFIASRSEFHTPRRKNARCCRAALPGRNGDELSIRFNTRFLFLSIFDGRYAIV
jgi:hypothetical protein